MACAMNAVQLVTMATAPKKNADTPIAHTHTAHLPVAVPAGHPGLDVVLPVGRQAQFLRGHVQHSGEGTTRRRTVTVTVETDILHGNGSTDGREEDRWDDGRRKM